MQGAAAILEYNSIESPLAQPRNMVLGQLLSSVLGVAITKLFQLLPPARFEDLRWLAGSLSVATASFAMGVTNTIHPPAGASALLAATNAQITDMGWSFIPLVLISDLLMLGSACLLNNIQRRFPQYWWTSKNLDPDLRAKNPIECKGRNVSSQTSVDRVSAVFERDGSGLPAAHEVKITEHGVELPEWLSLDDIEADFLRIIQGRLRRKSLSPVDTRHSQRTRSFSFRS
jgi:hypothetical protein